jgi:hypothetical protein
MGFFSALTYKIHSYEGEISMHTLNVSVISCSLCLFLPTHSKSRTGM